MGVEGACPSSPARVAVVHDYLTQRGGAERVVLSILRAFPQAPLYTSLFDREGTFAEFAQADVRTFPLDRLRIFRRHHRLALLRFPASFSRQEIDADVVICSSSGWAHGIRAHGTKIVYCYSPARWLYDQDRYLGRSPKPVVSLGLAALRPWLVRWDRAAAISATRYLTPSDAARAKIVAAYGIEAEVLRAPPGIDPAGPRRPVEGLAPGFVLCVARLVPHKNLDALIDAFEQIPRLELVVVGGGRQEQRLRKRRPGNVAILGPLPDEQLRWLYEQCVGIVVPSDEDYGLTPLEAAAFGKGCAVLRAGGLRETVMEDETGIFFDQPETDAIRAAIEALVVRRFDPEALRQHVERFSEAQFVDRLRTVVAEETRGLTVGAPSS